jgi:tetratricopeptide (TPR) repeat protein
VNRWVEHPDAGLEETLAALEFSLGRDDNASLRLGRIAAMRLVDRRRFREALEWTDRAIDRADKPSDALAWAHAARAFVLQTWKGPAALLDADFEPAIEMARSFGSAALRSLLFTKANAFYARGRLEEAAALRAEFTAGWDVGQLQEEWRRAWSAPDLTRSRELALEIRKLCQRDGKTIEAADWLMQAAGAAMGAGDLATARAWMEQALAELGDGRLAVTALRYLAQLERIQARFDEGHAYASRALELAADGSREAVLCLRELASNALLAGRLEDSREFSARAMAMTMADPALRDGQLEANTAALIASGDLESARRIQEHALATSSDPWVLLNARLIIARIAVRHGNLAEAESICMRALADAADAGTVLYIPIALDLVSGVASARESFTEAVRLFGAAEHVREEFGIHFRDPLGADADDQARCRDSVGDDTFDAAWSEGHAMSWQDAVSYATRGRGERKRPAFRMGEPHAGRVARRQARRRGPDEPRDRQAPVRRAEHCDDPPAPRLPQARRQDEGRGRRRGRPPRRVTSVAPTTVWRWILGSYSHVSRVANTRTCASQTPSASQQRSASN